MSKLYFFIDILFHLIPMEFRFHEFGNSREDTENSIFLLNRYIFNVIGYMSVLDEYKRGREIFGPPRSPDTLCKAFLQISGQCINLHW